MTLWGGTFSPGTQVEHELASGRHAWAQVSRGTIDLGPHTLEEAEALLFDLA